MPIYEYQCQACGHELEKLQRMADDPLKDCPDCGKAELRRLVSAAAFRLKGGGWYETDFKKGDKKNLHDSGSKPKSDSKAPAAKPVESKKSTSSGSGTKKAAGSSA